jgi:hypothetical protein
MHYTAFFFFFPVKHGVTPKDASYFVGRSYLSMVQDAERNCQDPKRFDDLIEEQTPGGLNEQVRACVLVTIPLLIIHYFSIRVLHFLL